MNNSWLFSIVSGARKLCSPLSTIKTSYYQNEDGKVIGLWPWKIIDMWRWTKDVNRDDYNFNH